MIYPENSYTSQEFHNLSLSCVQVNTPYKSVCILQPTNMFTYSKWLSTKYSKLKERKIYNIILLNRCIKIPLISIAVLLVVGLEFSGIYWCATHGLLNQLSGSMCGFIIGGSGGVVGMLSADWLSRRFPTDSSNFWY